MSSSTPARSTTRRRTTRRHSKVLIAGPLVVIAVIIGTLGYQSLVPSSSTATSRVTAAPLAHGPNETLPRDDRGALGEGDGVVPDGTTVFDNDVPAVAKLAPALLRSLRQAATAAAGERVVFYVDSGWRSPKYQEQLLEEAISKYGSREEAARWVAPPNRSAHVAGNAVDIGHSDATTWLSEHGAGYGLCQIYRNEPWHYELRPEAVDHGCPPMYADATQDPRMQQ